MKKINPYKLKSLLFIPAIESDFYDKLLQLEHRPSGIIFDLEDSIKEGAKDKARRTLVNKLSDENIKQKVFSEYTVFIRANTIQSPWFEDDMAAINEVGPDFLMAAKVSSGEDIKTLRNKSDANQIFAGVESVSGVENLDSILEPMGENDLFAIGYEDVSAQLMIERPKLQSINPLTPLLMAALAKSGKHDVPIIDAVSRVYTDDKIGQLERECQFTSNLGFSGKVAIHPNQIATINSIYSERNRSVRKRTQKVLDEFSEKDDKAVITGDEEEMMDTPSQKMYQKWMNKLNF